MAGSSWMVLQCTPLACSSSLICTCAPTSVRKPRIAAVNQPIV